MILNIAERTAEEHTDPDPETGRYAHEEVHEVGDVLRLRLEGQERLKVPVGELFPP